MELGFVQLRKLDLADCELLFKIRNEKSTYQFFKNPRQISKKEHDFWFKKQLENLNTDFMVITIDEKLCGYVRATEIFDSNQTIKKYEISIGIGSEFQGQGIGSKAMNLYLKLMEARKPVLLVAQVHSENSSSLNLFNKFSFTIDSDTTNNDSHFLELGLVVR